MLFHLIRNSTKQNGKIWVWKPIHRVAHPFRKCLQGNSPLPLFIRSPPRSNDRASWLNQAPLFEINPPSSTKHGDFRIARCTLLFRWASMESTAFDKRIWQRKRAGKRKFFSRNLYNKTCDDVEMAVFCGMANHQIVVKVR